MGHKYTSFLRNYFQKCGEIQAFNTLAELYKKRSGQSSVQMIRSVIAMGIKMNLPKITLYERMVARICFN